MIDAKAFGVELAGIVKAQTAPLYERISTLEKALAEQPSPIDVSAVAKEAAGIVGEQIKKLQSSIDSIPEMELLEAPELPDISAMIDETVKATFDALPVAKDGESITVDDVLPTLQEQVKEFLDSVPLPKDGASVTIDDVLPALQDQTKEFLEAIPAPKDGMSIALDDVLPALQSQVKEFLASTPKAENGKDGVGLAGAIINRKGELTITLTNGDTKELGKITGEDGNDGIGFEDMDIVHDGERGFTFRFQRGAKIVERSFTLPVMIDRGVFSEGKEYSTGDVVSFGGSMWVAQKETTERPSTGDGWRLSVKKGRDGKDGELKAAPEHKTIKVK